jgi:hypothetical protein
MREHSQRRAADDRRLADVAPPAGAVFTLHRGTTPLVVSVRHAGANCPAGCAHGWWRARRAGAGAAARLAAMQHRMAAGPQRGRGRHGIGAVAAIDAPF